MEKKKSSSIETQKKPQSNEKKDAENYNDETLMTSGKDAISTQSEQSDSMIDSHASGTEHISESSDSSKTKADLYSERQEAVYSEKTDKGSDGVSSKGSVTRDQNRQADLMNDEETQRTTVLSIIPTEKESDEPMLFQKEKIRKHKTYLHVRGWLLVALMFVLSVGATVLTFITIERLYINLAPFLGAYFGLFAVVALLHVLINVNRLPYWGFTLFPIVMIALTGVILLAFQQYVDLIFYMYVIIGIWGVAMLAFVHSMLLKGLMPKGWLFLMVPSIIVVAASVIFSFYPFVLSYGDSIGIIYDAVSSVTPLMITRGFFIAISIVMFIDALIWFIVKVREKDRLGLTRTPKKKSQNTTKTSVESKSNQDETMEKTENQDKQLSSQVDFETE